MKKKILFAALALLMTMVANAQFKYGIKAGMNISQLGTASMEGKSSGPASDMKIGFHIGVHANYSFTDLMGLQAEAVFSMQGGSFTGLYDDDDGNAYKAKVKRTLNYINIPVLFEIKPFDDFSIFIGPQFGFNIYKSASAMGTTMSGSDFKKTGWDVNTVDIAAVAGAQYTIMGQFLISARYNFGFTNTADSFKGYCNRVIQIGLGYQF